MDTRVLQEEGYREDVTSLRVPVPRTDGYTGRRATGRTSHDPHRAWEGETQGPEVGGYPEK